MKRKLWKERKLNSEKKKMEKSKLNSEKIFEQYERKAS